MIKPLPRLKMEEKNIMEPQFVAEDFAGHLYSILTLSLLLKLGIIPIF
jgi:hypothetical protein